MMCPDPETLSRWRDGELDARETPRVGGHVDQCPSCRRRVEHWGRTRELVWSAREPGPDCLSPEDMALAIEGKLSSEHLESCAWCATELAALRPPKRRATAGFRPAPSKPVNRWGMAAAAALFAVGVLAAAILTRPKPPSRDVVRTADPEPAPVRAPEPLPVVPPPPRPPDLAPVVPPRVTPAPPVVPPPAPPPSPTPAPDPKPVDPPPSPPPPTPVPPPRTTVAEVVAPRKSVAVAVRAGSLTTATGAKLGGSVQVDEGVTLRAEGRTSIEFAKARITLDGSSKFSVSGEALALADGALAAEVYAGSKFTLDLGILRVVPQAAHGRVLLSARPDRIVVEEGFARWGEIVLHEGVEHQLRKDKLEAVKGRTLPAAPRYRETLTWRLDMKSVAATRKGLFGRIENLPEGRMLLCEPMGDNTMWDSNLGYYDPEGVGLFTVKANTALRFRYFLAKPAPLELVAWNITKDENFNLPIETVVGQWTTVTILWRDVPANPGGRKVICEPGDKFRGVSFFVGKPGTSPSIFVERLEIIEIDRP